MHRQCILLYSLNHTPLSSSSPSRIAASACKLNIDAALASHINSYCVCTVQLFNFERVNSLDMELYGHMEVEEFSLESVMLAQ